MDILVESKLEYINEQELTDNLDTVEQTQDVIIETDIEKILNTDDLIYDDSLIDIEKNTQSKHLPFTDILNKQKINICRKEYNLWMNENYEMLQSAFYIISNKNFNKNIKINFNTFTEFCFLYN